MSAAPGGKRSPFTIAGNKKGVPFAGLDRASAYESFASLSSLKPQFLKTGETNAWTCVLVVLNEYVKYCFRFLGDCDN